MKLKDILRPWFHSSPKSKPITPSTEPIAFNPGPIWYIDPASFTVDEEKREVTCTGLPELKDRRGIYDGEGMVSFFSKDGCDDYEFFLANIKTGKVRQFADKDGNVLVNMEDIDLDTISTHCPNGAGYAMSRRVRYAKLNRQDRCQNGIYSLSWTLYPEGRYFADEDGYGAEDCDEEDINAIVNLDLEITEPFTYIANIRQYLKNLRSAH